MIVKAPEPVPGSDISRQLERILSSPDFHASPQQVAFLEYVVNLTLQGKADNIKGYTVATEVFGRGSDFDQSNDPIVSIQAGRLRRALAQYYETAGKNDPIQIDIPRGSFVPAFRRQLDDEPTEAATGESDLETGDLSSWPSVLIRPLRNLSGDPELDFWGVGLASELADELNLYPDIRVMTLGPDHPNTEVDPRAVRFVVDGSARSDGTSIKIIFKLTDTRTGRQIWSESNRTTFEAAGLIAYQEELARSIAVKIAGERGWIMKTLDRESKRRPPKHFSVYEAVLRYIEYNITLTPEAFSQALDALEKAVAIEPEYGSTWSMLARLYTNIYTLDIPEFENPLDKAFGFAQKGVHLSPVDQRCRTIMAEVHLLRGDLEAGLAEAEQALQLGPQTLFMLDGIGYLMTLMGEWERGPALIEETIRLNPFYLNVVHFALWVNCIRLKDYPGAYYETLKLNRPALFWDHLARAATLGLLGNIEEGRESAAELLKLKPDFAGRGRVLIGHYIKFEDIAERIVEGLKAVGVEVS